MDGSYPSSLRLWESPQPTVQDLFGPPGAEHFKPQPLSSVIPSGPDEVAGRLFACEALKPQNEKRLPDEEGEPYTLQWFLNIENHRHVRQARWIPRLLEFTKHAGETLLGLGHGLGTDWLQYARNGASVTVCSSSNSQLSLIRRHFQVRGLDGRFLHATPTSLPLENCCIDVACISGLLQQADSPQAIVAEVFRVLKPGGKVIAVTPAKYDVDYWRELFFFWQRWHGHSRRDEEEVRRRFSARRLNRLFKDFEVHRIRKRQLRRSELPQVGRLLPLAVLERLLGRVLVLKAFKPVSTAIAAQAAA